MDFFNRYLLIFLLLFFVGYAADNKPEDDDSFSFMKGLADKGWHDLQDESWNVYGQTTYISN